MKSIFPRHKISGFTLIELLVVVIIVGVLSAVALPSYLSQANKARSGEAKSALAAINRSQQGYRLENSTFAPNSTYLDAKLSPKFYTYTAAATGQNDATATATPTSIMKSYASGIAQGTNDQVKTSICESLKSSGELGYAAAAASATGGAAPEANCATGRILE
jgi:type IV pilus assembly protein PilA